MHTNTHRSPATEVKSSAPSPTDTKDISVTPATSTSDTAQDSTANTGTQPAESAVKVQLREAFEAAIASRDFINSSSLVRKAHKALEIPDPDARFRKLFKDVAIRNLLKKAPVVNGSVSYPSDAALATEVQRLLDKRQANQATA